jgi:hypothetical protein
MYHTGNHEMTVEMRRCIEDCTECHQICLASVPHCLDMGGEHATPEHIRLLLDCAEICQTSADFMLQGSDFYGRICEVCAEVCERCAQSCESLVAYDPKLRECMGMCRVCAESCREIARVAA